MKLSSSSLLAPLLLAASASAATAHVYLPDSPIRQSQQLSSITPSTARLIFADRLNIAKYHDLGSADDSTIEVINHYGGRRPQLFTDEDEENRIRILYFVEGCTRQEDIIRTSSSFSNFTLQGIPSSELNHKLLTDIQRQMDVSATAEGQFAKGKTSDNRISDFWTQGVDIVSASGNRGTAYSTALASISNDKSDRYQEETAKIRENVRRLVSKAISDGWDVTIVIAEPQTSGSIFKRATAVSWGKYTLPARRQLDEPEEEEDFSILPVSESISTTPVFGTNANDSSTQSSTGAIDPDTDADAAPAHSFLDELKEEVTELVEDFFASSESAPVQAYQQDTTPPRGILPACYTTMDDCISTTHNCSGHGSCYQKYGASAGNSACFACGCRASRYDVPGGTQVTKWAGPACQKKDISVPFWVIGSTVVGLLGAAAWGVGILYAMGAQDLPSVLSAGVAGPRPK